jgi:serine/threonine protein kinase
MPYYCEGDFAKELARRKKEEIYYTEEELRNMMKQIVSAVDHLHSKSLMHRDLKPANLFMADNGQRLVLGDFGLVKELEEDFANTVAGTMKYLAPEILSMKKYNLSADVWSLGCIMLELTQLELSKVMYIDALVKNDITAIVDSMVLPRYSRNIARTIGKMLQANPDDRPTTSVILKMLTDYEIEETESFGRPMQGIVEYDLDLQKTRLVSGEDWSMVKHIFAIDNSVHVVASSVYRVQNNGSYDKISLQCGWHHSIGCQIDGKIYFIDQDPKLQTHPLHVYNPNDGSYITLNKENWGVCKGMAGHGGYLYLFCAAIYKLNITNGKYVKASTVTGWSGCYNAVTVGDRIFVTSPSSGKIFGWAVDTDEYSTISGLPMHEYTPYIHKDNKLYMFGKQKVTLVNLDTNEIQEREDIPCNVIAATYIPHLNKVWFISY